MPQLDYAFHPWRYKPVLPALFESAPVRIAKPLYWNVSPGDSASETRTTFQDHDRTIFAVPCWARFL